MKRFSIKLKLTLLYSFIMILVTGSTIAILFSLTSNQTLASVQSQLKNQVIKSIDDIEEEEGDLDIDSDFYSLEDNIYLSIYDSDFVFLYGKIPRGFNLQPDFLDGELQTFKEGGQTWYVFDLFYIIDDYGPVYIRGITSASQAENEFRMTMRFAVILLPFLVLVTEIIGYRMVCRTLQPVRILIETVQEIQRDKDLSRRIGLAKPSSKDHDEIYHLAATFDQMLERLEESFQSEKQFTSDVSHELKTPVSVILAQCEACLEDSTFTAAQREQITLIERKARQMSGIISQLLLLSRADQNRQQLMKEYVNISELTEMTAEEQQILAKEKQIFIHTDIEPDIYTCVDETFYIRMLINLISNAVYYGKNNGNIYVALHRTSGRIILSGTVYPEIIGSVRDDGVGIPAETLPHIWERFYRADISRTDGNHSGLGLAIVKWIIEAHGGWIRAESTPGVGSVFTFALPDIKKEN